MVKSNTPRLCGGTFFILLLQVRIPRRKSLENYAGKSDSFTDPDMLEALIRVMDPNYPTPSQSTFKNNTSQYKSCNISTGTYLPFEDETITTSFDDRIKRHYAQPLRAMSDFISTFISVQHNTKCNQLVKALLELIQADDSINGKDSFYILENGKAVTKSAISSLTDICLQSFILGIWHFIIMNRPDNKIGRSTFEQWHKAPKTSGQSHTFISNIGEGIIRDIRIKMLDLSETDAEPEVTVEDDYTDTHTNQEDFNDDPKENARTQTINNPIVFNQNGNNSVQIGHIATLTINN